LLTALVVAAIAGCNDNFNRTVWRIGAEDVCALEFALTPDRYADFLAEDFGWEDRFYLIGRSQPAKDFPYILPGPRDAWGGSAGGAGVRTQTLNILFGIEKLPAKGDWMLNIGILNANDKHPPLLKITVNDHHTRFAIPSGNGNASATADSCLQRIVMTIDPQHLRRGGNEITLTTLEGSWLTFDFISLEAPSKAKLQTPDNEIFVRSVCAADYQTDSITQPLLVDVEHLEGEPVIEVQLDGKTIFRHAVEQGRYVFEAPMPAVTSQKTGRYRILSARRCIADGHVVRSPQTIISPADYVNTLTGTAHSRWMIAPGPWMPFSMVKLSPDNENAGWQAGYQPSFESIGTFSHIHEWTMAGLGMMPTTGTLKTRIGDQSSLVNDSTAYRSQINKRTEKAPIGYYSVQLTDYDILAELTATTRCGFHRYTYPLGAQARIMLDLKIPAEYNYEILKAEIRQTGSRRVEGFSHQLTRNVWSSDAQQEYTVYFAVDFDHDITRFGGWTNDSLTANVPIRAIHPDRAGCFVEFDLATDSTVQAACGISFVDLEGARRNLKEEITEPFGWKFDSVRSKNVFAWNEILRRITVTTPDRREKQRFYTNLYRSFCRNIFSDTDGRWTDATEQVRQLTDSDGVALGCDAFWNTFWNLNQVWNLIAPEWSSRWVRSQLAMFDANGWLAKGPAGMEYIPVMVAEHEIPLMVSAWQMGIRDFDVEKMFAAIRKMQTTPAAHIGDGLAGNRDLEPYLRHHFVPAYEGKGHAWQNRRFSNTLEYSFDDWTVAQLALSLGKTADYKTFSERGQWWRNAIDTVSGYARLRYANSTWAKDFDPFKTGVNDQYVEGNGWQLTFFVPQDIPALADMIGRDRFISRLDSGFRVSEEWRFNAPNEQYGSFPVVHGNQQSMHFAWLFNWVGEPRLTQHWLRSIIDRYYGFDIANACLGDEDQGQMSAWFIMAALGLFQTDGGCRTIPIYEIGSPLFEKTVIDLGGRYGRGTTFTIEAIGTSRKNKYVVAAELNGKPLESFYFPAQELLKGGTLKLTMGK
jgi:predicted alpha-1,2-mannosidase